MRCGGFDHVNKLRRTPLVSGIDNVYNSLRQKLQTNFKSVRLFLLVVLKVLDSARPRSSSLFLYNVRIVGALARS